MKFDIREAELGKISGQKGAIALIARTGEKLKAAGALVDHSGEGALSRILSERAKEKPSSDQTSERNQYPLLTIDWPGGIAASKLLVGLLPKQEKKSAGKDIDKLMLRKLGGELAAAFALGNAEEGGALYLDQIIDEKNLCEILFGFYLRAYRFDIYKTQDKDKGSVAGKVEIYAENAGKLRQAFAEYMAVIEGVYLARDLVNEPANVLTTAEFAERTRQLSEFGVEVQILDEAEMAREGMRTMLAVGQGSPSESYVSVMRWRGDKASKEKPLLLIGKGVVFDAGGVSIKPATGMEEMTMDMGGAALVCGVMRALAGRKAACNVTGIVGIVENMPGGNAQRPGDIIRSMSGKTVEVINTDAEGRLVLADLISYAQKHLHPKAMIDFATLTGAIIIALGHEKAGLFASDDQLAERLLASCRQEGEGLWRMPVGAEYAKALQSRLADIKNIGGREAAPVTAAQFLHYFVDEDKNIPWAHIDIAGVTVQKKDLPLSPKGATGWGVASIDRLIREHFE